MFFIVSVGIIVIGGVFGWMVCMCIMVFGMIVGFLLFGVFEVISLLFNMIILVVVMLGIMFFFIVLGYFFFK